MFLEEVANRLQTRNVGRLEQSIFFGSKARIPVGDGPFLSLIATGGTGTAKTQNNTATQRPTAQVFVRAKDPAPAIAMINAAYDALGGADGLYNITLDGVFYLRLVTRQEPTDVGSDDSGRVCYAFNIEVEKQRS